MFRLTPEEQRRCCPIVARPRRDARTPDDLSDLRRFEMPHSGSPNGDSARLL